MTKSGVMQRTIERIIISACGKVTEVWRMRVAIKKIGKVKRSSGTPAKKPRRSASRRDFADSERFMMPRTMRRGTKVAEDFLAFL